MQGYKLSEFKKTSLNCIYIYIHKVFILLGLVQQFNNISVISWWLDLFAEEMASLEGDSIVVFYYLSTSEI
jgi:hypothetical protein